jgi:hypothetical protein
VFAGNHSKRRRPLQRVRRSSSSSRSLMVRRPRSGPSASSALCACSGAPSRSAIARDARRRQVRATAEVARAYKSLWIVERASALTSRGPRDLADGKAVDVSLDDKLYRLRTHLRGSAFDAFAAARLRSRSYATHPRPRPPTRRARSAKARRTRAKCTESWGFVETTRLR